MVGDGMTLRDVSGAPPPRPGDSSGAEGSIDSPTTEGALPDEAAPALGPSAWRVLYHELGERVFRMIHRMTRDEEIARDLTHDTFVRVFERADQYAGLGSVESWVFQIAANLVRQRARTRKRRTELLEQEAPSFDWAAADDASRVESKMVLDKVLEGLPDEQRAALLLYEVDGYTHAEIGEMLGIAEGSSKARVSRAKATLRERLEGQL